MSRALRWASWVWVVGALGCATTRQIGPRPNVSFRSVVPSGWAPAPCEHTTYAMHAPGDAPSNLDGMPRVTEGGERLQLTGAGGDDRFMHPGGYYALFSPDGARIVTVSSRAVIVWDPATGRSTRTIALPRPQQHFSEPAFTPDGRTLMFGVSDGTNGASVRVDLEQGSVTTSDRYSGWRTTMPDHRYSVAVAVRPEGTTSLMAGEGSFASLAPRAALFEQGPAPAYGWLFADGRRWLEARGAGWHRTTEGERTGFRAARFELVIHPIAQDGDGSTSGPRAGADGTAGAAGERTIDLGPEPPRAITMSQDGRAIAVLGTIVRVFSSDSGTLLGEIRDHRATDAIALSPDGSALIGWHYPRVRLLSSGASPDGANPDPYARELSLWEVASARRRWTQRFGPGQRLVFSPSGRFVVSDVNGGLHATDVLDAQTGESVFHTEESLRALSPAADVLMLRRQDGRSRVYSLETRAEVAGGEGRVLALIPGAAHFAAIADRDDSLLLVGDQGRCARLTRAGGMGSEDLVQPSLDGRYLSAVATPVDRTAAFWTWRTDDARAVSALAPSAYGHFSLVTGALNEVRFVPQSDWYYRLDPALGRAPVGPIEYVSRDAPAPVDIPARTGRAGARIRPMPSVAVQTATDRVELAITPQGEAFLWREAIGRATRLRGTRVGDPVVARFASDGSLIAVASLDHTVRVYDAQSGALRGTIDFDPRVDDAARLAFSSPARELMVHTTRGALFRFALP